MSNISVPIMPALTQLTHCRQCQAVMHEIKMQSGLNIWWEARQMLLCVLLSLNPLINMLPFILLQNIASQQWHGLLLFSFLHSHFLDCVHCFYHFWYRNVLVPPLFSPFHSHWKLNVDQPCARDFLKHFILIPNVRSLSSQTFPFMGMFDWEEGLNPLALSLGGNALTQAFLQEGSTVQ